MRINYWLKQKVQNRVDSIRRIRARMKLRLRLLKGADWLVTHVLQVKLLTNSILIVKLDAIGDFIIWLDAAQEFRNLYPDKKIVLCANAIWASLAECLPYWDEVIPVDLNKLGNDLTYRFKLFIHIRTQRFQIAIQPTFSREFYLGDSLIRITGADQRIGSQGDTSTISVQEKTVSDRWYTRLIPANALPLMESRRNAEFIRGMGATNYRGDITRIAKLVDLPDRLRVKEPYCVIFPGASNTRRMWPAEKFAMLSAKINSLYNYSTVLCGGVGDKNVCDKVALLSEISVINLAGKTSLVELVEVIRHAKLLVGNETSAVHIAAAVNTPTVCLLGGGHFGRFMPYDIESTHSSLPIAVYSSMDCFGCNWHCIYPAIPGQPDPCIARVDVEQVVTACNQAIQQWREN